MSQYKSAVRSQQSTPKSSPHREKASQLHELFPHLPVDELEILLTEVNGDVQLAAARIADGAFQPWDEVSRKKDKKTPTPHNSKPSTPNRGDSRGSRGGRGGRGGARGRGGHSKASGNGHVPHAESTIVSTWGNFSNNTPEDGKSDSVEQIAKSLPVSHDQQNGILPSTSGKTDSFFETGNTTQATSVLGSTSSMGHPPDSGASASVSQTAQPVTRQPSKTPATSKLSWAQIARPQERPVPLPTPSIPLAVQTVVTESESKAEVEDVGPEEPTTVEGPTWDETKQISTESWLPIDVPTDVVKEETPSVVATESHIEVLEPTPKPIEPLGDVKQDPSSTSTPVAISSSPNQPQAIATPSPKLNARPAVSSHRSSARYKVTDQPVTLPVSFGAGIEKVGMQFGSLNVGDASTETIQHESDVPVSEQTLTAVAQSKAEAGVPLPPPATAPATSTSLTSMFQHGPNVPQSSQAVPSASIPHHTLPTSISQPISSSQSNVHAATPSSIHQFPQQQQTSAQQQPTPTHNVAQHQSQHQAPHLSQHLPHLPQQLQQNQAVHSLNQHVLVHLDQTQQMQTQQPLQPTAHSTYFRGSESSATTPYFPTPTPPVGQTQDSSYGSFGQLTSQGQHQQSSHSNAFGNNDYSYNDRFYESYTTQQGFTSRNPLGHDDMKVIPGNQQNTASTLPPSASQGPQPPASSQQPQSASGQGPQQTYPPPVPYYFPHAYPQNQYYGSPYTSGYVPQPFVKYPAIFQPGPPAPASAGNPAAKQPGNVGVQPQTYNGSLYQQAGYDDYQTHQHSQHQHQHSHSLGLNQGMNEYGKQLYGAGQSSMQGFMGLGGQSSSGGNGPASNTGPRASPEAPYKAFVKDVNVTRSVQGQQGQVPPQSQVQGPNGQGSTGQGFYSGNRFGTSGASSSGVGGGPQQGGQQAHLGYPQGVNEPNFYGYHQPRQQQGYWQ